MKEDQDNQEIEVVDEAQENEDEVNDKLEDEASSNESEKVDLIDEYAKEIETLKDKVYRITAEYDNFRKRTQKEKENIYTGVCEDVLKLFLPVFDNLERADMMSDGFEELKKGIELTIKQFKDAFNKLNVEEIDTNIKFDPNIHDAVMHCQDDNYGEKEIVEVFTKGYKRGNKILRHSMVKVAN